MTGPSSPGSGVRWILLCGTGLAAGLTAALALATPIEAVVGMVLVTPVMLAIAGSVLGVGQSLALGGGARAGLRWTGASAAGMAAGMSLGIVLIEVVGRAVTGEQVRLVALGAGGRALGLVAIGAVAGLALGLAQGLITRAPRAALRRWTTVSAVGYGVGLPVGGQVAGWLPGGLGNPIGFIVFLGLAGLVVGALTARDRTLVASPRPLGDAA